MVADRQSRVTFLAADLLSAAQPSPTPLPKTRVGGFRRHSSGQTSSRRRCRSMFTPGSRGCGYKTVSGRHEWVNRDPIQERAGINLYELVANNPISWYDWLGLAGGAGKPNGSPCCLEDEPNWQVEGYSSESACVHAWVAPYERRTIVPRAFSRLWYLYMSYQVGFGGGLYAQAFIDCDAGICVKWGHKNGCHCDP
jgi:hypothetical protein